MILDKPIKTREEDLLGHETLAIRIAEAMRNLSSGALSESFVVGIEGDWGSGKTSLINLVMENLEPYGFPVVKFNPWNFSDQNELVTDFFNSVAQTLEQAEGEKGEGMAESIRSYFPKLLKGSSIDISPRVSFAGFELNFGSVYKTGDDTLEKRKEKINGLLGDIQKPIVIVIDDIDRLESQETRLVFKLVKMTANFPNTVFLLAYDRERVGGMLTDKGVPGEEFLKKIVQLSFPLPRVDQKDLFGILFKEVDEIVTGFGADAWDQRRWEDLFESGLKKLFPTVRDIKRYVNSVRLDLEMIGKEEVNPVDFLGIEAIRVFATEVYFTMAREKSTFAFPATDRIYPEDPLLQGWSDSSHERCEDHKKTVERVLGKGPEDLREVIERIIRELFPQVGNLYSGKSSHEDHDEWKNRLRVCSGDVFDKYFSLSVVASVISEAKRKSFLETIDDRSVSAEKLDEFRREGKLHFFLEKGLSGNLDGLGASRLENLLICLFDLTVNANRKAADEETVSLVAVRCFEILKMIAADERPESLRRIIGLTEGVFGLAYLMYEINRLMELREKGESGEEPLLAREDMGKINGLCAEKIRKAAQDGFLENYERLGAMLSIWKKLGDGEDVKEYACELIKTDSGLLRFLKAHVREDGYGIQKNRESMGGLVSLADLDRKVGQIESDKLNDREARIVEAYKRLLSLLRQSR